MSTITVVINGGPTVITAETTLAQAIAPLVGSRSGVAVALDEAVVPRQDWEATTLHDGARVEVLVAVQGG